MKKAIAIVHYNTPELTEAAILSVRKHTTVPYDIYVFDNSDTRPFKKKMNGVKVFDNTKGKYIDFEAELEKYPDRNIPLGEASNDGSFKHIISVQKLFELVPEGFILLESDVLIRKNFDFLWNDKYAACGKVEWYRGRRQEHDRLLPWLCYLNVPLLVKHGARYFDPDRCWNLYPDINDSVHNYWDTGSTVLADIIKTKPALWARFYKELDQYFVHYHGASWRKDVESQKVWLEQYRELWYTPENKNAKIFICTHRDFDCPVHNDVYQIIDARKTNKDIAPNGLRGSFYSEILTYQRMAERKKLPKIVGFCGWRKYFNFMDNVPELSDYKCIVSAKIPLGEMTMRDQYASFSNVEDIDILTGIIDKHNKKFSEAWHKALEAHTLHPYSMFVMPADDFRCMMEVVTELLAKWVLKVGKDIEGRIAADPKKYHVGEHPVWTPEYRYRIGGELGERIISAWIDWQFPDATQIGVNITAEK